MTDQQNSEQTAGGLVGRIAGKAKEAAGSLVGDRDLAREGRLQQAQVDAEAEAGHEAAESRQREAEASLEAEKTETETELDRLQNEVAAQEREQRIERERQEAEREAQSEAKRQRRRQSASAKPRSPRHRPPSNGPSANVWLRSRRLSVSSRKPAVLRRLQTPSTPRRASERT